MKKLFFACLMALVAIPTMGQINQILGDWTTVDDKTGEKRSIVHIYKSTNGMYYGKILSLVGEDNNRVCTECDGADHNQPIVGLVIIRDMKEENGGLVGGKVLDPESGKLYYAKITLKDGKLILRGSLDKKGLLGRNQTWVK